MQIKINLNQGYLHSKIDICVNFYKFAEKNKDGNKGIVDQQH